MKRFDYRLIIGGALVLGGILMLLDRTGVLRGATSFFWAGILAIGAGYFLWRFFSQPSEWWTAIPGFALAGMAASTLTEALGWGGFAFLLALGVGFFAVYLSGRERWWAIIPGGVLVTLGVTSALTETFNVVDTGGVFFVGLGLTFLLVALLARMKWAYIPAAVLLMLGFFLGTPFQGIMEYAWIAILLIAGGIMVFSAVRSK